MNTNILAFGAHPDDVEFGCGGVIARETAAGRTATIVIGSRGEAATHGSPRARAREAKRGAACLGAKLEFVKLGGDAHFEVTVAGALRLAAIIRRLRPSLILAPTVVDTQHPDHAALGRLVRQAARLARYGGVRELRRQPAHAIDVLLHYAITVEAEPRDAQPIFCDVSAPAVMAAWQAAMRAHATQAATRRYTELQLARAFVNGQRCSLEAAIALWPAEPLVFDSLAAVTRSARRF